MTVIDRAEPATAALGGPLSAADGTEPLDELPPPGPHDDAATLLHFAERQARPLRLGIAPDGDDCARPPLSPNGPERALGGGRHRLLRGVPYPHGRVAGTADDVSVAERLEGVLGATAPQRFEPRSAVNPHRAYPAAHCFYAARIVVVCGRSAWHYDPIAHAWQPLTDDAGDPSREIEQALVSGATVDLVVLSHRRSIPSRYRELRWSLGLGEAGHLARLLVEVARVHGFAAVPRLGAAGELAAAPDPVLPTGADWVPGATIRLTWPALTRHPRTPLGRSWDDVLFERSAGRANKGFSPAPGPLTAAAAGAVLAALDDARADVPSAAFGGVDLVLLARDVEGIAPGRYRLRPGRPPELLAAEHGLDAVQAAFAYPVTQMSVSACPAALVMVGDHRAQIGAGGTRGLVGLRRGLVSPGYLAQAAGLAMTAHGGFLRPARSFDPDLLAGALDLPAGRLPGYLGLLGTSSFTDLLLDVRP